MHHLAEFQVLLNTCMHIQKEGSNPPLSPLKGNPGYAPDLQCCLQQCIAPAAHASTWQWKKISNLSALSRCEQIQTCSIVNITK